MVLGLLTTVLTLNTIDVSVRVEGEGYFRLIRDGRAVYAKSATFGITAGKLTAKGGASTLPAIQLPSDAGSLSIEEDGTVRIGPAAVGRLMLANFAEGSFLTPDGPFLIARNRPILGYAGTKGFGKVVNSKQTTNDVRRNDGKTGSIPKSTHPTTATRQHGKIDPPQDSEIGLHIFIPAEATIEGTRITLGEIAQFEGSESLKTLDLGNAPVHGVPMLYSRERILSRLSAQGIDRKNLILDMPATVRLRRPSQVVSPEQLIEKAKAAVQEKLGLEGELTADGPISEIEAPKGELRIDVESVSLGRGVASVTIGVRVDGKRFHGRTIRLSGSLLEVSVEAGSSVSVRFVSNGIVIEAPGRARNAGVIGQTIDVTVTNPDTREATTHAATVVGRGRVEVRL